MYIRIKIIQPSGSKICKEHENCDEKVTRNGKEEAKKYENFYKRITGVRLGVLTATTMKVHYSGI